MASKVMQKNEAQEDAIRTIYGPVMIVSCPGSGKTTTLLRRIHHMQEEGIKAENILMVTFTNAAAKEMRQKYMRMYGRNPGVTFATIHSLCFHILKEEGLYKKEDLLEEYESQNYLFDFLKQNNPDAWNLAFSVRTDISIFKNNYTDTEDFDPSSMSRDEFKKVYRDYELWKTELHRIDYDDMLFKCREYLEEHKDILEKWRNTYRFIQVDEYQDVNYIQRDIIYLLAGEDLNLCVVGDDDQSIYRFRGARPEIMLSFEDDFPGAHIVRMSTNYRSGQRVVTAAGRLIKNNKHRFNKDFISSRGERGFKGDLTIMETYSKTEQMKAVLEDIEALRRQNVPYKDMAVMYRANRQAESPAMFFVMNDIPFYSTEAITSRYNQWMFRDIKAYALLACGMGTNRDMLSVMNRPVRGLREKYLLDKPFEEEVLMEAAENLRAAGKDRGYLQAKKSIKQWFHVLGPGKLSLSDSPNRLFSKLSGAGGIWYEKYLTDYAKDRKLDVTEMLQDYEELKAEAIRFETIEEWFSYANRVCEVIKEKNEHPDKTGIALTTMHKSKGLEWPYVFIIDANTGVIPHRNSMYTQAGVEEERRLFYVAVTRAKDMAKIIASGTPSPFLEELTGDGDKIFSVFRPKGGSAVRHKKYGQGQVVSCEDDYIVVLFGDNMKRFKFPDALEKGFLALKGA